MTKSVLVSFAIIVLTTSGSFAATKKSTHHHATKPAAATSASTGMGASSGFGMGGPSKADHDMYIKNQRAAGLAGKK